MLRIEDKNIQITRGDMLPLTITAENDIDDSLYEFSVGDTIRFKIFDKNNPSKVYLEKDFIVAEQGTEQNIVISASEMKIGEIKNKGIDYWYEIELNPDTDRTQTIEGYEKDSPAVITILPEGGDKDDTTNN